MKNKLLYATSAVRRVLLSLLILLSVVTASSCRNSGTETVTYDLKQLSPNDAMMLIENYVPGGAKNVKGTEVPRAVTVTAPRSRLDQVEQLLKKYDRPSKNSQLTFQIIEANGFTDKDPAIADVEAAIRQLFKFKGYRLLASTLVIAHAPGTFSQAIDKDFVIQGTITDAGGAEAVHLDLKLFKMFPMIETSVMVPTGQAVVVGATQAREGQPALILVVRNDMK